MSRRVYILALVAAASVAVLLLLHHNVDRLPFATPRIWDVTVPEPVLAVELPICQASDPFEAEYGRTNLRMTRAYEGEQQSKRFADIRLSSPIGTIHPQSTRWSGNHYLGHRRKQ
jgi:hypothetical protein